MTLDSTPDGTTGSQHSAAAAMLDHSLDPTHLHNQPVIWLLAIFTCLSLCGLVLCFVLIGFNIKYRNARKIKMSSPRINLISIHGASLLFISCPLHQIAFLSKHWYSPTDASSSSTVIGEIKGPAYMTHNVTLTGTTPSISANYASDWSDDLSASLFVTSLWTLSLGFTLFYGSLLTKAWRVHKIFDNAGTRRLVIHDAQLMLIIFLLILMDLIILILWQIFDPIKVDSNRSFFSNYEAVWMLLILGYKFLLLVIGAYLSWVTRLVAMPYLGDSLSLMASTYAFVLAAGIASTLVTLSQSRVLACGIIQAAIIVSVSVSLSISHVIKIVHFIRNSKSDSARKRVASCLVTPRFSITPSTMNDDDANSSSEVFTRLIEEKEDLTNRLKESEKQVTCLTNMIKRLQLQSHAAPVSPQTASDEKFLGSTNPRRETYSSAKSSPDSGVEIRVNENCPTAASSTRNSGRQLDIAHSIVQTFGLHKSGMERDAVVAAFVSEYLAPPLRSRALTDSSCYSHSSRGGDSVMTTSPGTADVETCKSVGINRRPPYPVKTNSVKEGTFPTSSGIYNRPLSQKSRRSSFFV